MGRDGLSGEVSGPWEEYPSRRKSRCKGPEAAETLGVPGGGAAGRLCSWAVKGAVRAAEPGPPVTLPCRQEGS